VDSPSFPRKIRVSATWLLGCRCRHLRAEAVQVGSVCIPRAENSSILNALKWSGGVREAFSNAHSDKKHEQYNTIVNSKLVFWGAF
jgi:hypothetical protein